MLEEAAANAVLFGDINSLWTIHATLTRSHNADALKKVENSIALLSEKK